MKKTYKKPEVQYSVESNTLEGVFACIRPDPGSGDGDCWWPFGDDRRSAVRKTTEFDPWVKK